MASSTDRKARRVLLAVATLGLAAAVVLAATGGADAAVGAVLGVALTIIFLFAGRIPVRLADNVPPAVSFLLLGLGYVLRVVLLLAALAALRPATWVDSHALGLTVIATALAWSLVALRAHQTSRQPTIETLGAPR